MYSIALGAFEYILISAAASLGDGAYGVAIREEIALTTRGSCSIGAHYTTIDRLEKKGLIKPGSASPRLSAEDVLNEWCV
jgi:PadR family transcriptional regulator